MSFVFDGDLALASGRRPGRGLRVLRGLLGDESVAELDGQGMRRRSRGMRIRTSCPGRPRPRGLRLGDVLALFVEATMTAGV